MTTLIVASICYKTNQCFDFAKFDWSLLNITFLMSTVTAETPKRLQDKGFGINCFQAISEQLRTSNVMFLGACSYSCLSAFKCTLRSVNLLGQILRIGFNHCQLKEWSVQGNLVWEKSQLCILSGRQMSCHLKNARIATSIFT